MKNIESTPPSLSNPLAGVRVYPELIAIEPWSTPDPEVRAYFEASRPDVYPILPPRDQLNPQAREALAVFDKADELRAEPGYEATRATSCLLAGTVVESAVIHAKRCLVKKLVDEWVESGRISSEETENKIEEYIGLCRVSSSDISNQVLHDCLPEGSPLFEFLQPGSSVLGRIAILEALGLNEENIKGSVAFGSRDIYNEKVRESNRFFDLAEEGQEEKLEQLLDNAKDTIKVRRAEEERRKEEAARVADIERIFGGDIKEIIHQIEAHAESLRQDDYKLASSSAKLAHNRKKIELAKGSLAQLRQDFPDLCYPSGLNVLDYLSETHGADSTAAVLVGAQVAGIGRALAISPSLATIYLKSDSPEDQP